MFKYLSLDPGPLKSGILVPGDLLKAIEDLMGRKFRTGLF